MRNNEQTLYDILRISQDATLEEIKIAYRQRCMEYHPDVNPGANNRSCHVMMCKINEAYTILRNMDTRRTYDEELKSRGQYYCSTEKPEEKPSSTDTNNDNTSRPSQRSYIDEELYRYYNSVDFDEDIQKEFIFWMEEYFDRYYKCAYAYYQKCVPTKNDIDLLTRLYKMFKNIIVIEKELAKKRGMSKRL